MTREAPTLGSDTRELASDRATGPLRVLVLCGDRVASHPLPEDGQIVVGRGREANVRIDDESISRRHAVLHLGERVEVEDLGSVNGTRINQRRLAAGARAPVGPGDTLLLGEATLVIQRGPPPESKGRPARLHSHEYFEARLEDECGRGARNRTGFAVLRLGASSPEGAERVRAALAGAVRGGDVVATSGPADYEVLLPDASPEHGRNFLEQLTAELGRAGVSVRSGMAAFPRDGRDPDGLLAHAATRPVKEAPVRVPPVDLVMVRLFEVARRLATGKVGVLIQGETGAGKEVVAEAIHQASARAKKPFVRINCAALPEQLAESELFGHEKGSFTGAEKRKVGLLESAQGGTVLLDEVGELSPAVQAKLLRVLEQGEVMPVGATQARPLNIRVLAATHRDLEADVAKGRFRQDLLYRLNAASLVVPPLRERPAEILELAQRFAHPVTLSKEAQALLQQYSWPGNVRELRNVIERAVLLCEGRVLEARDLPVERMKRPYLAPARAAAGERERVVQALARFAGNQTLAAKELGISRRTLLTRLDELQIPRPRKG